MQSASQCIAESCGSPPSTRYMQRIRDIVQQRIRRRAKRSASNVLRATHTVVAIPLCHSPYRPSSALSPPITLISMSMGVVIPRVICRSLTASRRHPAAVTSVIANAHRPRWWPAERASPSAGSRDHVQIKELLQPIVGVQSNEAPSIKSDVAGGLEAVQDCIT